MSVCPLSRERPGRLAERLYALERRRQSPRASDTCRSARPGQAALPASRGGRACRGRADAVSVVGLDPRLAQPAGWAQALGCVQAVLGGMQRGWEQFGAVKKWAVLIGGLRRQLNALYL